MEEPSRRVQALPRNTTLDRSSDPSGYGIPVRRRAIGCFFALREMLGVVSTITIVTHIAFRSRAGRQESSQNSYCTTRNPILHVYWNRFNQGTVKVDRSGRLCDSNPTCSREHYSQPQVSQCAPNELQRYSSTARIGILRPCAVCSCAGLRRHHQSLRSSASMMREL